MHAPSQNAARWLAIWLPRLATDRLQRAKSAPSDAAAATYAKNANAFTLTCVNAHAHSLGLTPGIALADAKAMIPTLFVFEDDAAANARALDDVAAWCERFTPIVVIDGADGLLLDVTGCAHLFGGEEEMLAALEQRLTAQGFTLRAAIAPTPCAAWALVRYAKVKRIECGVLEHLAPITVKALRLSPESAALLNRLGLKTIGQLYDAPRASLAARAGEAAMLRLDQALGRAREALSPRRPPPPIFASRRLLEPIFHTEAVLQVAETLSGDMIDQLDRRGVGVRRACLHLFGVDGRDHRIDVAVSRPAREGKTLLRLFRERLNLAPESINAEFGIEAARLDAVEIERIEGAAQKLVGECDAASASSIAALVDVLSARLGSNRVLRAKFNDAHMPERAAGWRAALQSRQAHICEAAAIPEDAVLRRPLRLFTPPQPIEAIATVPDGPPARFRWRRVLREVKRAEGPERIAGEWTRAEKTRDYYRVEDAQGRRYWVFREGLYGEADTPRWFLHGLFA